MFKKILHIQIFQYLLRHSFYVGSVACSSFVANVAGVKSVTHSQQGCAPVRATFGPFCYAILFKTLFLATIGAFDCFTVSRMVAIIRTVFGLIPAHSENIKRFSALFTNHGHPWLCIFAALKGTVNILMSFADSNREKLLTLRTLLFNPVPHALHRAVHAKGACSGQVRLPTSLTIRHWTHWAIALKRTINPVLIRRLDTKNRPASVTSLLDQGVLAIAGTFGSSHIRIIAGKGNYVNESSLEVVL